MDWAAVAVADKPKSVKKDNYAYLTICGGARHEQLRLPRNTQSCPPFMPNPLSLSPTPLTRPNYSKSIDVDGIS